MHPSLRWIYRPPRALQVILGVGWLGLSGWFWYRVYVAYIAQQRVPVPDAGEIAAAIEAACGAADGEKAMPALRNEPVYPLLARWLSIEGSVVIGFSVEPDGSVSGIAVRKSVPSSVFDQAAIDAVSHWQYCPRAERTSAAVRLDFKLDPPDRSRP